jgi:hypothetical protein
MRLFVDGVHFIPSTWPERYAAKVVELTGSPAVAKTGKVSLDVPASRRDLGPVKQGYPP